MQKKYIFSLIVLFQLVFNANARTVGYQLYFLDVNPVAWSRGMGDIGVVASKPYYETGFTQNPALLAGSKHYRMGIVFSLVPFGGNLHPNPFITSFGERVSQFFNGSVNYNLSAYYKMDSLNTIAYTFLYSHTEQITLVNNTFGNVYNGTGNSWTTNSYNGPSVLKPYDFYHDLRYSRVLSKKISIGAGLKYIRSFFYKGEIDSINFSPINTLAGDIGMVYKDQYKISTKSLLLWSGGASITNIGPKTSFNKDDPSSYYFMPTNLNLGAMLTYQLQLNYERVLSFDAAYQAQKFLIPSQPDYASDSSGRIMTDANGNYIISEGKNPNVSAAKGMLQSFYDTPGGAKEELKEIYHRLGMEVRYNWNTTSFVAMRLGRYFFDYDYNSKRHQNTFGLGVRWKNIRLDYSSRVYQSYIWGRTNLWSINAGYQFNF